MKVEVIPNSGSVWNANKDIELYENRATALLNGIGLLKMLQRRQSRSLESEKKIVDEIETICNCKYTDNSPSHQTLFAFISVEHGDPIVVKGDRKGLRYENEVDMPFAAFFKGLVQGDKRRPWSKTSDKNKWYLHFGTDVCQYYAPVTGFTNLSIRAF